MTIKLYWEDSHLTKFSSRVVDSFVRDEKCFVQLEQTAFYPLGGGQPGDVGWLSGVRVNDVSIDEAGTIFHQVAANQSLAIGETVQGEIDWAHRLEMLQQHTGQHILSQAFWQLFGAETKGFRITSEMSEIDLALDFSSDEIIDAIRRAEDLANQIVFENRAIRVHQVTAEQAAQLPLRKESFIADCIRVIEIADFDWSPCGGTHAQNTGEVGLIAVRGWERAKKMLRLRFACGVRALQDYRLANSLSENIARKFSVGRDQVVDAVEHLLAEQKKLQMRVRELSEIATKFEAEELIQSATITNGVRFVVAKFEERSVDEIKSLAHCLIKAPATIAILAVAENDALRLVFARSADLSQDMNALMKKACGVINGKGGGKADFAQGGGKAEDVNAVWSAVVSIIS